MKKKLTSKSLAILSLVLVLLITFGVFLGLEWRKANDVGVASDGVNAYVPNYKVAPEMICDSIRMSYMLDTPVEVEWMSNPMMNLSLSNNITGFKWPKYWPYYLTQPDDFPAEFPDTSVLGKKDLIFINYARGDGLGRLVDSAVFKNKIKKGIENGVKFVLLGQNTRGKDAAEKQEQVVLLRKLLNLFGVDGEQGFKAYSFAYPYNTGSDPTVKTWAGYGLLKGTTSNFLYVTGVYPFVNLQPEHKVIYETIDHVEIVTEFSVGDAGSVLRLNASGDWNFPEDDRVSSPSGPYPNTKQSIDHAYEYTARFFSCADYGFEKPEPEPEASCTTFETLPSNGNAPKDQLKISKQFESEGFRFSLKPTAANTTCPTLPQIAVRGGKRTAFFGSGSGSLGNDNPDPSETTLGNRFLTDDGIVGRSACQLNVSILPNFRSKRVEFDIIDIDKRTNSPAERFNIVPFGKNNKKLTPIKTPVLNNRSKSYKVVVEATEDIHSIQVVPIGTVSTWGVAYDNFCSVK